MIKLSVRQFAIIKRSIERKDNAIEDICAAYKISRRTAYREIKSINQEIGGYGQVLSNSNGELDINGNISDREKLKNDLLDCKLSPSVDQRKKLILSELLQLKQPVKMQYFAKKYGVSAATISYDLKDLDDWFTAHNLLLITKPGYGVLVKGDESDFRRAIVDFLYENTDTHTLVKFLNRSSKEKENKNSIEESLVGIIDTDTIIAIKKSVKMLSDRLDFNIIQSSYMGLVIHLALAIKRIESGENIEIDAGKLNELKTTEEYEYAKTLAGYLEDELDINIPEGEIGYITVHLKGARYRANTDSSGDTCLKELVESMIDMSERKFGMVLSDDGLLSDGLLTHLEPALYRLYSGLAIRNPLLNDIKAKYTKLYDDTKEICKILEREINQPIPDDEVGYIAMHFGAAIERKERNARKFNVLAVCASGIGTSRMMLSKLRLFPQINVVGAVPSSKVDEAIKNEDLDLIVSTIPLKTGSVASVTVNPLLLDEDVEKIRSALNTDLIMNREFANKAGYDCDVIHIARYGRHLLNLLERTELMELKGENSNDIIEEFISGLIAKRLITGKNNIISRLLDRESLGRIVLPGRGFVIYHCSTDEVNFPIMVAGRLTKKISMKNLLDEKEDINTAFLMLAPEDDREGIEIMGDISVSLIEDADMVKNITAAKNISELKSIVEDALKNKYMEEIKRVTV